MKKISFILVLALLCSCLGITAPVAGAADGDMFENHEIDMLVCLGVQTEQSIEDKITVGDYAEMLAASVYGSDNYAAADADAENAGARYLADMGIIDADALSDAALDFETALQPLVRIAGYDKIASNKSVYDMASEIGIINAAVADKSSLTVGEAAKLIYKTLFVKSWEMEGAGSNVTYKQADETILAKYRDVYRYRGFVYDNGVTAIDGKTRIGKDCVKVGDLVMKTGKTNLGDYLGYYADVLYEDNDGDYTAVGFKITEKNNNVLIIDSEDIEENSSVTKVNYIDKNNRIKTANISKTAEYILNGTWVLALSNEDMKPENGQLRLIDINNDDVFDIVMLDRYTNVVVKEAVQSEYIIFGLYETDKFYLDDKYDEITVYKNGVEIEFSEIAPYDVLAVYESEEGVKIEVCTDVEYIKITSTTEDTVSDGQNEYDIAEEFINSTLDKPKAGQEGTVYFGKGGKIVFFEENIKNAVRVGYLHKVSWNTNSEQIHFKVYSIDNKWGTYQLKDKIYLNDIRVKALDLADNTDFIKSDGSTVRQLIKYIVDVDNTITKVYTVDESCPDDDVLQKAEETQTYKTSNVTGGSPAYVANGKTIYSDGQTKLFQIPNDPSMESAYRVSSSPSTHNNTNSMTAYYDTLESKRMGVADYFVQMVNGKNITYEHRVSIVKDLGVMVDENEDVRQYITVLRSGTEKTYFSMENEMFNALKKGDAVQLSLFMDEVTGVKKLYSPHALISGKDIRTSGLDEELLKKFYYTNNIDSLDDENGFITAARARNTQSGESTYTYNGGDGQTYSGSITYKSGNYMTIVENGEEYKLRANEGAVEYYKTKVYIFDKEANTVSIGKVKDIYSGCTAFAYIEGSLIQDILVVK